MFVVKVSALIFVIIAVVLGGVLLAGGRSGSIELQEAKQLLEEGAVVLDVRTEGEFDSGHIKIAHNVPLDLLRKDIGKVVPSKDTIILCHCRSGVRSGKAVKVLQEMGYSRVWNIGSYERAKDVVDQAD